MTLAILHVLVSTAAAYDLDSNCPSSNPCQWTAGAATVSVNTYCWPAGTTTHLEIEGAVEAWDNNNIPGSSFGTAHGDVYMASVSNNDGLNVAGIVDLGTNYCGFGSSYPVAFADPRYKWPFNPNRYAEVDIGFNDACVFTPGANHFDRGDHDESNDIYSPRRVMLHEMGHLVGLDHEIGNSTLPYDGHANTMDPLGLGSTYDISYLQRGYLINENDREGIRSLYPDTSNTGEDVAVQSYHVPDEDTEFAWSTPACRSYLQGYARPSPRIDLLQRAIDEGKPAGSCPDDAFTEPLPLLTLSGGSTFYTVFSMLNLADGSLSGVTYRYRLSTSPSTPSPAFPGRYYTVASGTVALGAGQPYEKGKTLTIPGKVPRGYYYLWLEIDYGNAVSEIDESNNRAVWNRRIRVVF